MENWKDAKVAIDYTDLPVMDKLVLVKTVDLSDQCRDVTLGYLHAELNKIPQWHVLEIPKDYDPVLPIIRAFGIIIPGNKHIESWKEIDFDI